MLLKGFYQMLTPSQNDVVSLLIQGYTNKEIAEELNVKVGTVKCHLFQIYKNYGLKCDRELIAKVYKNEIQLLPIETEETTGVINDENV